MKTLNEVIEIIKAENPTIQLGDDEQGYTQLNAAEYEAQIETWADVRLEKEIKKAEAEEAKALAQAKLAALGLTAEELKAALGSN